MAKTLYLEIIATDRVFFKGDVTPLSYDTLYNKTVHAVSDHLPVKAVLEIG